MTGLETGDTTASPNAATSSSRSGIAGVPITTSPESKYASRRQHPLAGGELQQMRRVSGPSRQNPLSAAPTLAVRSTTPVPQLAPDRTVHPGQTSTSETHDQPPHRHQTGFCGATENRVKIVGDFHAASRSVRASGRMPRTTARASGSRPGTVASPTSTITPAASNWPRTVSATQRSRSCPTSPPKCPRAPRRRSNPGSTSARRAKPRIVDPLASMMMWSTRGARRARPAPRSSFMPARQSLVSAIVSPSREAINAASMAIAPKSLTRTPNRRFAVRNR